MVLHYEDFGWISKQISSASNFGSDLFDESTAQINFYVGILLGATVKLIPLDNKDLSSEETWRGDRFTTILRSSVAR